MRYRRGPEKMRARRQPAASSEFVFTYVCQFDGQITWNRAEIDDARFWEFEEIEKALGKEILSDNFEDEFKRYRKWAGTKSIMEIST